MKPENTKDRKSLFIRFIVFFILAILIVIVPVFVTLRLPAQENEQTSGELKALQDERDFQRDFFAVRMDSVKGLVDSYNSDDVDIDKLNADIGFLLSEMEKSIASDTTWRASMNKNIVATYLSLKKMQNKILEVHEELDEVTSDLAKCKKDLKSSKKPKNTDSLDPL
ncbi:hypothetical protein E9993_19980 [Labilibacter sediminis]|nr:hypothetical protein E9993_19980 [Labilibacter sediminis]